MTRESKPTPGPFVVHSGAVYSQSYYVRADGPRELGVAETAVDGDGFATNRLLLADRNNPLTYPTERDDNVAFAAHAMNLHADLVAVLEHVERLLGTDGSAGPGTIDTNRLRAVLARARQS